MGSWGIQTLLKKSADTTGSTPDQDVEFRRRIAADDTPQINTFDMVETDRAIKQLCVIESSLRGEIRALEERLSDVVKEREKHQAEWDAYTKARDYTKPVPPTLPPELPEIK